MAVSGDGALVAICRQNCSIENWLRHSWSQLLLIPGNKNCPIRNVHWLEQYIQPTTNTSTGSTGSSNVLFYKDVNGVEQPRRLVTTGLNGMVVEWDLLTKGVKAKHSLSVAIWNSQLLGKQLFLACEDGSVKIVSCKKEKIEF